MKRRDFLAAGLTAGAAALLSTNKSRAAQEETTHKPFRMNYAPNFRIFKNSAGEDLADALKFMHDQGFRALEDGRLLRRPVAEQNLIGGELERLDMTMGTFIATVSMKEVTMAGNDPDVRAKFLKDIQDAVEVAKRVNATWVTVVPGRTDERLAMGYQTANVIDNLKRCVEICEPSGLILIIEPLNWLNHPGLFLHKIPQAYQICKAVDSPLCKICFDMYHQQITEGNIIPNINKAWSEIAYFQVGDNPGRKEPTTGEMNYRNIFKHIHSKGYKGVIGMEHLIAGKGAEGEQAVIDAYRYCDSF